MRPRPGFLPLGRRGSKSSKSGATSLLGGGRRPSVPDRVLGPSGLPRTLYVQTVSTTAGTGVFLTGSVVFFTQVMDLSATQVGIGASVAGLVSLLAIIPMGVLSDRFGARKVWLVSVVLEALLFFCYPLARGIVLFLLLVAAVGLCECANSASRNAYTMSVYPGPERIELKARLRSAGNIGYSIGSVICGIALWIGTDWAYYALVVGNGISFLVDAVFIRRFPDVDEDDHRKYVAPLSAVRDASFVRVAVVTGFLAAHSTILSTVIPLLIVEDGTIPKSVIAWLAMLNAAIIIIFQVPASRGAESAQGAARLQRRGGLILALGCAIGALSSSLSHAGVIAALVAAVIVMSCAEMFQSAGQWGVGAALSPAGRRGEYLSGLQFGIRVQKAIAPVGLVWLTIHAGAVGWLVLTAVFTGLALVIGPAVSSSSRRRSEETKE